MRLFQPQLVLHRLFRVKSELQEVYMNQVLQHFAVSMIGVFIPIFILTIGFSLMDVLVFMVFFYIGLGFLSPVAGRVASKIGLKHAIMYSSPLIVIYYMLMVMLGHMVSPSIILLHVIGILGGSAFGLYWISLNSEFVKNSHKLHRGAEAAKLNAYPRLASIAAPVIGAFLIATWGYDVLFAFVLMVMGLSVAPLFATDDYKSNFRFMLRDTRLTITKKFSLGFFSRGFSFMTEAIMWPIFIYLTFNDLIAVGIAAAMSGIGVALFTLFVGKIADRVNRNRIIQMGGLGFCFVWVARMFITTELEVFTLSLIGGMLMSMIAVSMFSMFSETEKDSNIVARTVSREIWLNVGRIVGLFLFLLFLGNFQMAFALTALVSLLLLAFKA